VFGVSLGLVDLIAQILLDYFARQYPINVIEDPFPMLPTNGGLIPVKVPLTDFTVRVTDDEMIAEANVGWEEEHENNSVRPDRTGQRSTRPARVGGAPLRRARPLIMTMWRTTGF
jgi:hypothetical protein